MITRLKLHDFKAFHSLDVEFGKLTLLLGPNNSGKSSILAPLRLLAQTSQSSDPGLPLLLDGPLGDFGTFRDMVHGNHRGRPMQIHTYVRDDSGFQADIDLEFKYRTRRRELVLREVTVASEQRHLATATLSSDAQRLVTTRLLGKSVPAAHRSQLSDNLRMLQFIPRLWLYQRRRTRETLAGVLSPREVNELDESMEQASYLIYDSFMRVDYLSAMRQPPERTYHQTGAARTRIGANGENWAGLFVLDMAKAQRARAIVPGLTRWLRQAGLAADVRLHWLSDRHYEVLIEHPVTGEAQNLADVGQANSQVIPVLVGGLRLDPGSTYLVEEPEIHLHPGAQAELGDFFVDLLSRGVNSIVETHSEYLVLRLLQHVAAGKLSPDDVVFYYVKPVGDNKVVKRLELDAHARFKEPLDGGFFPQRLTEARKLAKLRGQSN